IGWIKVLDRHARPAPLLPAGASSLLRATKRFEWIASRARRAAGADTRVPKLIVIPALLRIGKYVIRFLRLLEFLLGLLVVLVHVWVKLAHELAVRLLDLISAGALGDTQNIVIIAFCHGGQYDFSMRKRRRESPAAATPASPSPKSEKRRRGRRSYNWHAR